jgi:hypothetical protein
MKKSQIIQILFSLLYCLLLSQPISASEIDISGFFDFIGSYQNSQEDNTNFGLGQAEVDLESEFSERFSAAVAVAFNNETGNFELGAAELGISLYDNEENFLSSAEVVVGQFDVPFGIDYHVYPSIERKFVTAPIVVDLTHAGWNDFGVQLNLGFSEYANAVVYGVNGFESSFEVIDEAHALQLGTEVGEEVNTTPANAFGTRLGISPVPNMEIGASVAMGFNQDGKDEMALWGVDWQLSLYDLDFKGEFIKHSLNRSIEKEENKGYYLQSIYHLNNVFLMGRYGAFQPDGDEWSDRISFGAGYIIGEGVELRFESTINTNTEDNMNILQIVAGF